MSTISFLGIENTSLGTLSRLPAELRNCIYDLSITTDDDEEVDFHEPCRRRYNLCLASKQIYDESKGFLAEVRSRSCTHINYRATLQRQPQNREIVYLRDSKHNIMQAHAIRFITGHLAGQAPLAVTLNLQECEPAACEVFGASKGRTRDVLNRVEDQMERFELIAMNGQRLEEDFTVWHLDNLARTIAKTSVTFSAERMILVVLSGKGRVSGRVDVL